MGKFSQDVRRNQFAGPNQRAFDKEIWSKASEKYDFDEQDQKLNEAGLLFNDLLTSIREVKQLEKIPLTPFTIIRILISISTYNLFHISIDTPWKDTDGGLSASTIFEHKIKLKTGQSFSPDELITGMGDGLKHILRELLYLKNRNSVDNQLPTEIDITRINNEFNLAILYQCAVEYWLDCVGNGYALKMKVDGVEIAPQDELLETARIASIYRRLNIETQNILGFYSVWKHNLNPKARKKICGIPLVSKVYGVDTIERIELDFTSKVLESASTAIAAKMLIEHGYYGKLLKTPLPNFANFDLNIIIDGWRLLHSLASICFDNLKPLDQNDSVDLVDAKVLAKFSRRVSKPVLVATFAKALDLKKSRAEELINLFIFTGAASHEIWSQPIIYIHGYYYPIFPALTSVHLLRIVETWMRQGGLDLELRGKEFENYCIAELKDDIAISDIKDSVYMYEHSFEFSPPKQRKEEIDIVIAIGKTVLIIEAKCILWPDDALQFANYRDTVEKAALQIKRKKDSILSNLNYFTDCLEKLGHKIKPTKILCCVLTNSAVYSGFPISGIPIVDLSILGTYFRNELIKSEMRKGDKCVEKHVVKFYKDAVEASNILENFLLDPPQLQDTKKFIKSREIVFPMKHDTLGPLTHKTFMVEINAEEMMTRHNEFAVNVS